LPLRDDIIDDQKLIVLAEHLTMEVYDLKVCRDASLCPFSSGDSTFELVEAAEIAENDL